jgi:Cache 3/Cache 2 fusion domain
VVEAHQEYAYGRSIQEEVMKSNMIAARGPPTMLGKTALLTGLLMAFAPGVVLGAELPKTGSTSYTSLQATIFSFDGKDFVRSETTLTADAKSAANTKLDENSPAYKALIEKHSYTGPVNLLGRDFQTNYAPLTDETGKLTGALFVGEPKKQSTPKACLICRQTDLVEMKFGMRGAHGEV